MRGGHLSTSPGADWCCGPRGTHHHFKTHQRFSTKGALAGEPGAQGLSLVTPPRCLKGLTESQKKTWTLAAAEYFCHLMQRSLFAANSPVMWPFYALRT